MAAVWKNAKAAATGLLGVAMVGARLRRLVISRPERRTRIFTTLCRAGAARGQAEGQAKQVAVRRNVGGRQLRDLRCERRGQDAGRRLSIQ